MPPPNNPRASKVYIVANRISKHLVTFDHPFRLAEVDEDLPAGNYTVETENQDLDGTTFIAHRRIETVLIVCPPQGSRKPIRFIDIDPNGLAAALALDKVRNEAVAVSGDADQSAIQRADNEGMAPAGST